MVLIRLIILCPLGILPASLSSGNFVLEDPLNNYEKIIGISEQQLKNEVINWGDHVTVLPSSPIEQSIPLFWTATNPADSNESHYRIVPLLK